MLVKSFTVYAKHIGNTNNKQAKTKLDSGSIGSSPVPLHRKLINVFVTSKDELSHFVFEMTALRKTPDFTFFQLILPQNQLLKTNYLVSFSVLSKESLG